MANESGQAIKGRVIGNNGDSATVVPHDGTGNIVTFVRDPSESKASFLEWLPIGGEVDMARASVEDDDTLAALDALAAAGTPLSKEQFDTVLGDDIAKC